MSEATAQPPVTYDVLLDRYVKLRDKKDQIVSAHKKEVAKFDEALERIENVLLRMMNETGTESVRTIYGTAYKTRKTSAVVADWDCVSDWVKDEPDERWSMLEKRVSKSFVEAYREAHNDLPPGVDWREEIAVNVKRS